MTILNHTGTQQTYSPNATDPDTVVCFDTDMTIDYARGPVPLDHVTDLRDRDDVLVWSTGFNQTLRDHAEIPGMAELKDRRGIDRAMIDRKDRMPLLKREYPDADEYIVVDDVDLRMLEPEWSYYQPAEYAIERVGLEMGAWPDFLDFAIEGYLRNVGRFKGQFPPQELVLGSGMPYSDRTEDGVAEPVQHREVDPSGRDPDRKSVKEIVADLDTRTTMEGR